MADASIAIAARQPLRARMLTLWRASRRLPIVPASMLAIVVAAGILAPWISPHHPERTSIKERLQPPAWVGDESRFKTVVETLNPELEHVQISLFRAQRYDRDVKVGDQIEEVTRQGGTKKYLLGTDHLGRDILTRMIYGARISLIVAGVALATGGTLGVTLGLLAGWYGGWVDELIMRLVDIELAIPIILVALVMVVALGHTFNILLIVLAIWIWPRFARQIRGEVLQLKTLDYVALARVAGASTPRILFKHLFPGVTNTLIVVATLQVGIVILLESSLSYLGAGVPSPTPAWGSRVAGGRDLLAEHWWVSTIPGLAILATVMSLNLFGDWLRDTLDPRLRQRE